MNDFVIYTALVSSVIFIFGASLIRANGIFYVILYKALPYTLSVCNLIIAGKGLGWF